MNPTVPTEVLFLEHQQFRQIWLWLLMLVILGATIAALFSVNSFWMALLITGLDGVLLWFIYSLKLTTEVRQDGIYIRFFPMFRQSIPFSRISRSYTRTYRPILEYGGWGVRFGWKGRAYNVSGNRGVQLELTGGKGLLIGSQRSEELARVIGTAMAAVPIIPDVNQREPS